MMDVLISILLPAYNVEKYIGQCFESIIGQDLSNCEVIVVDDGSTDGTGRICDKYSNKYSGLIKTIHKKNEGLLSARREGIRQAKGEYCMFVDSDDYLLPDALQMIKSSIEQYKSPDAIIYNYTIYDESKGTIIPVSNLYSNGRIFCNEEKTEIYKVIIETSNLNAIWIKAFKTELLRSDPMDYSDNINNSYGEDILQSLYPLTYAQKIVYLGEPLYCYRINTNGMIRTYTIESLKKKTLDDRVSQAVIRYINKWGLGDSNNISYYISREINGIMQNVRNTASNISLNADERLSLYETMEMINERRNIREKKKLYNDKQILKRIMLLLFVKKKYRIVHYLSRAMRGFI